MREYDQGSVAGVRWIGAGRGVSAWDVRRLLRAPQHTDAHVGACHACLGVEYAHRLVVPGRLDSDADSRCVQAPSVEFISIKSSAAMGSSAPGSMQGTTEFHH